MINFEDYGIVESKSITYSDLVCLANVTTNSVDTKIVRQVDSSTILISGEYSDIAGKYAVAKEEIVKITDSTIVDGNTQVTVERKQYGTVFCTDMNSFKFRTVEIFHKDTSAKLIKFNYEDSIGSLTSTLFPCEVSTGSVTIQDDLQNWSPFSTTRKYIVRNKKTVVYLFKGVNSIRFLKNVALVTKTGYNTRGKEEAKKIKLTIKNVLSKYYDKSLAINQQLKSVAPKEFFEMILDLDDEYVYYAKNVTEDSFITINNLHTKEYTTYSGLLQAYCSNGVRFCFDRFERVKIFSDFKVSNIESEKTYKYNITNSMLEDTNQLIYNSISVDSVERSALVDFSDMNEKYVEFFKSLPNCVKSDTFLSLDDEGNYTVNDITIEDDDLFKYSELQDYVLFKQTQPPYKEFYARILAIESPNVVKMTPILYDKDYKLLYYGKFEYLYDLLNNNIMDMDLYYVREELPMVWKYTRNKDDTEIDSNLAYPLLPKVDGENIYSQTVTAEFGCATDLSVGEYSGITEEISGIYGTWDSDKLLYNMEREQFSNTDYPPIFALSNQCTSQTINGTQLLKYTTFDNSNLEIVITKPEDDIVNDADISFINLNDVNSEIDLYTGTEVDRISNQIIEIENPNYFHVGDVLVIHENENATTAEQQLYEETLIDIRWGIFATTSQVQEDGSYKYYIYLDSAFPTLDNDVYTFTRFPNSSIIYLQEFYIRGNPVISYTQEVEATALDMTDEGETSEDIYEEQEYSFDAKQLDRANLKLMIGYILDNFNGTSLDKTKYKAPIDVFNGLEVELLDVISVVDTVNTHITEDIKWLVVSSEINSSTNVTTLTLINLNKEDAEPYDIDINDVLTYDPIEIPEYSHTGGEGTADPPNDGTGGTDKDDTLGQFWLSEIDKDSFSAYVDSYDGKYIYFKNFYGTEKETYLEKLFPVSEFGIRIDGEVIFVQSDSNYRVFIKKRGIYDTEETNITAELDVTFLVTTSYTDVDGTLYSRKANFGDGDNYLKVDPITGVKIQGDFLVGENNQTSTNDLWQAIQKTKTFYQEDEPVTTDEYYLSNGDTWIDISDGNKRYTYLNSIWFETTDTALREDLVSQIDGKINTYNQSTDPSTDWSDTEKSVNIGDLWSDTSESLTKRWNGESWDYIGASDIVAQELAQSKKTVFTETPEPPYSIGDLWITNLESIGDLKVCITPKSSGNFVASDFILATKYTDDTVADTAQESADTANALLADIASDSKVTPNEKALTNKEWGIIQDEYIIIKAQAEDFELTSDDYTTAYNALDTYITPILSNLNLTSTVVGDTFKEKFINYYNQKQILVSQIADKNKSIGDTAQESADTANALLAEISSDDKITPSEKINVQKEWEIIQDEYTTITTQAEAFSVDYTDYTSVYDILDAYITPILTDMTTTSSVSGDTFKATFVNYYSQKQIITSSISDYAKASGDNAQSDLNEGRLVINQNTTFNGDANFISQGTDEYIQINGGSIDFYRNDERLTNLKNIRFGSVSTDAVGSGTVSFSGFNQPMLILPTIKTADFDENIASFYCYTELIDSTLNTYKFYLGATSEYHLPPTDVTQDGQTLSFSDVLQTTLISFTGNLAKYSQEWHNWTTLSGESNGDIGTSFSTTINKIPSFRVKINRIDNTESTEIYNYIHTLNPSVTGVEFYGLWEDNFNPRYTVSFNAIDLGKTLNYLKNYDERNDITYSISIEIIEPDLEISISGYDSYTYYGDNEAETRFTGHRSGTVSNKVIFTLTEDYLYNFSITANAETSTISDAFGYGVVNYIAMEIE